MDSKKTNRFQISITDNQDKFSAKFDIDEITDISCKMLDYITKDTDIIESSVLKDIDLSEYTFGVDIVFCDDKDIEELNTSYRGKNQPTDVLSFALFADNPDENFIIDNHISLGEVIISLETAKRQAASKGFLEGYNPPKNLSPFQQEVYFLLSHGILHLLGFDHPDDGTLEDMLALQHEMTEFALK